jgi:chromosome segregation ATPase
VALATREGAAHSLAALLGSTREELSMVKAALSAKEKSTEAMTEVLAAARAELDTVRAQLSQRDAQAADLAAEVRRLLTL